MLWFYDVTIVFFCSLRRLRWPQFLSNFLEISLRVLKPQGDVGNCIADWSVNIYCFWNGIIFPPFWIFFKIDQNKVKTFLPECARPPEHESVFIFCVWRTTSSLGQNWPKNCYYRIYNDRISSFRFRNLFFLSGKWISLRVDHAVLATVKSDNCWHPVTGSLFLYNFLIVFFPKYSVSAHYFCKLFTLKYILILIFIEYRESGDHFLIEDWLPISLKTLLVQASTQYWD